MDKQLSSNNGGVSQVLRQNYYTCRATQMR